MHFFFSIRTIIINLSSTKRIPCIHKNITTKKNICLKPPEKKTAKNVVNFITIGQ